MKAYSLETPAPIETSPLKEADLPVPIPGDEDVLIRVLVCGLCHTDLHVVEGDLALPQLPIVPGHQIVGVVEEVGQSAGAINVGDTVGVGWFHSACGACAFCRDGKENLCPKGRFTGYHVNGGYAQFAVAPAESTYPIPHGYSEEHAAPLLCGGVIGYRALHLSGIEPGRFLGLYGFGASAHIVIQIAVHWGCRVLVFTRSPEHRQLATTMGAVWVGQAQDVPPEELDASIIFAPAGELVPLALKRLKRGGKLVLAGITMSPIPEMPYQLLYGERTVQSVANATRRDARELLALAAEIPIKTEIEVLPLMDLNQALQRLKEGKINGAAVARIGTA
ncbi:MAG: zinc-dependent alcohol dehydrogenase family protein [Chloroflexi bacterium]|nr:zinc-dependent alcohol dehydrogenase family protein [Chloroflexota bacterium]